MTQTTDMTTPSTKPASGSRTAMPYLFDVSSVEKISAPDGGDAKDWYRYVLKSRRSTITGHRRGSRKDVQAYAARYAEQLNTRAAAAQSVWNPRGRKPAAAREA